MDLFIIEGILCFLGVLLFLYYMRYEEKQKGNKVEFLLGDDDVEIENKIENI